MINMVSLIKAGAGVVRAGSLQRFWACKSAAHKIDGRGGEDAVQEAKFNRGSKPVVCTR